MINTRTMLVGVLAGILVGAYAISVGLDFGVAVGLFVAEVIFCYGGIVFATRFMPELISRHLDWQLKRRGR